MSTILTIGDFLPLDEEGYLINPCRYELIVPRRQHMTTTIKPNESDSTEIQMGSAVPTFLVADVGATPQSVEEEMTPQEQAELEAQVEAMGHKYYGIFADDPGAMEVFDVIERVRDQSTTGGNRCTVKGSICVN